MFFHQSFRHSLRIALPLAALACASGSAHATLYNVTFTGTITNSRDAAPFAGVGVIFGGASEGGQNGQIISGSMLVNVGGLTDTSVDPTIGSFGMTVPAFPQPANPITSQYTIGAQTFFASQYMGPTNAHGLDFASMQDRFISNGQQDIFWLHDGSQALACSDPQVAATCTGGTISTNTLALKFFGLADILSGDTLEQTLSLDLAALTAIVTGPGGGQTNSYLMMGPGFDTAGEFNLTSLTMSEYTGASPVPEPSSLLTLLAAGLATLGLRSRKTA